MTAPRPPNAGLGVAGCFFLFVLLPIVTFLCAFAAHFGWALYSPP